jgi:hypothetical protein
MIIDSGHHCQMVDMTNISIHENYDRFLDVLTSTEGFEEKENVSNPEYAIYYYPQSLIRTNSNLPFFMASPKLFSLMNDTNASVHHGTIGGRLVLMRIIVINSEEIAFFKLGTIAHVPQGISTGQNNFYLRRNEAGEGYLAVDRSKILRDNEIVSLSREEKINGVNPDDYSGRHYIPFDKGSETDSQNNWLSNYYVPTNYYIDWSLKSLQRMRSLTIADRKLECGEKSKIQPGDDRKLAAALRNQDQWFQPVISFSPTGQYSPTFRLGVGTVSQNTSSGIIVRELSQFLLLGVLASCFARYLFKNFLNHSVHTQEGDITEFLFPNLKKTTQSNNIEILVQKIIKKQQKSSRYDYASNEQIEIDRLVYEAYGLNEEDIAEVENWYARRYPKLARAQNCKKITGTEK